MRTYFCPMKSSLTSWSIKRYGRPNFWQILQGWKTFGSPCKDILLCTSTPCWTDQAMKIGVCLISIHGDEVPCYGIGKIWSRSALSFSWCSIAQNFLGGACSQIMLYIFALFEKFVCPSTDQMAGTMETFFKVLSWSLNAMWEGKWPEKDWTGKSFVANTVEWCPKMKCICFLLSFCFVVFAK